MILKLCGAADLPSEGAMRAFRHRGLEVCLARLPGDTLAAFANKCPHQGAPLSAGSLEASTVICPYHAWGFNILTGAPEVEGDPALEIFELRRYGDEIFVRIPQPISQAHPPYTPADCSTKQT